MELKGSKTEANLMTAYAGESQARNTYHFYAAQARKEGYQQIANIFQETSDNEMAHAKLWFNHLRGGSGETGANLEDAAAGERYEWREMYAGFAKTAREEGFDKIAQQFEQVANIEQTHESRFSKLRLNMQNGEVFERKNASAWVCLNCGHIHEGLSAPEECPTCFHPKAYFMLDIKNY